MLAAIKIPVDQAYSASLSCFHAPGAQDEPRGARGLRRNRAAVISGCEAEAAAAVRPRPDAGPARQAAAAGARSRSQSRGRSDVATFHPRDLIKQPSNKSLAWKELLLLMEDDFLKSGLLAFGTLIWAAPVFAQATPDPLAPLAAAPQPQPQQSPTPAPPSAARRPRRFQAQPPIVVTQAVPRRPSPFRKTGAACSMRSTPANGHPRRRASPLLPKSVLTSVAKAELYTAKGSPVVDLASLQALIAEAPSFRNLTSWPQWQSGAGPDAAVHPSGEKPIHGIGSAPIRYKARPVQGEPYADQLRAVLDPLIKADDAAGAEAELLAYAPQISTEARAEAGQRVAFVITSAASTWTLGASLTPGGGAQPANGRVRLHGFRPRLVAAWRLRSGSAAFKRSPSSPSSASQGRGYYWAARRSRRGVQTPSSRC